MRAVLGLWVDITGGIRQNNNSYMRIRYYQNDAGKRVRNALVYTWQEHAISAHKIDSEAVKIIRRLQENGYEAYLVGGAVRDLLIGKQPKDFDIATAAEPGRIRKLFRNSRIIGKRFRLVHVFFGEKIYEVSTFRSTENGTVGNQFGSIREDVQRRDFTLNALYYDPIKRLLVDYVHGFTDIREKRLTPIIKLSDIFTQDPVRMLRAVKYSEIAESNFPFFLRIRLWHDAPLLETVSDSRLTEEIHKIICCGYSAGIIKRLIDYGLYGYLQPQACAFIEDVPDFYAAYLNGFKELDALVSAGEIKRQGQCLVFLIRDFIRCILNISDSTLCSYYYVYRQCRHFVLPMNPRRTELEYAIKYCLRTHNRIVKIPARSAFSSSQKKSSVSRRRKKGKRTQKLPVT